MGYNSRSNLVKLIDMDLNLEENFKEFENAFEHNEVCENTI
jgi:exonuclease VII small subunit